MVDPITALTGFAVLVLATAVVAWPGSGLWARAKRARQASVQVRVEDALKHLYKSERSGRPFTVESLAGALEITRIEASRTLNELQERGLVALGDPDDHLTDDGRAYALQVIRTHRLLERFLADRTGVEAVEWHDVAEEKEHEVSAAEAEALSARLGHPRYDPHGDPIPTAAGELPERGGVALTRLSPGQEGVILHLEDEPPEIYQELVALGLSPQMEIRIQSVDGAGNVTVEVDGRAMELRPSAARNVTLGLRPLETEPAVGGPTLADLLPGEVARVVGISPVCQGVQRRRLLDLGVVPGTPITAELFSASGDPAAYLIRGALIALRRDQARWIQVELGEAA